MTAQQIDANKHIYVLLRALKKDLNFILQMLISISMVF